MSLSIQHPWLIYHQPNPRATIRLFCFPYVGSSASIYRSWATSGILPAEVEVCAVELPGHGTRQDEPLLSDFSLLAQELTEVVHADTKQAIALFGHSLGALMSFEVTRQLYDRYGLVPNHLFVSACLAPHIADDCPDIYDGNTLLAYIRGLGGLPNENMILRRQPLFQADFALRRSFRYVAGSILPCPITAFGGEADPLVSPDALAAWRTHTRTFAQHTLPGNHFFIHSAQRQLLQLIGQAMQHADQRRVSRFENEEKKGDLYGKKFIR